MKNRTELEKQFKEECTVINMDAEYPGNPSPIKWTIITGYSREELEAKYSEVLSAYTPYEIAPSSLKDAIDEYNRNEDKHRKRQLRNTSIFDLDEEVDAWCPAVPSFVDAQEMEDNEQQHEMSRKFAVREALMTLTKTQRRRLCMHLLKKMTFKEIAEAEGIKNHKSVVESVQSAESKFKKYFLIFIKNTPQNGTPLSKYSEEVITMSGVSTSSTSTD